MESNDIAYLEAQLARGLVILFVGAGFSVGARDHRDRPLPTTDEFCRRLWDVCYPSTPFEQDTNIQDLYQHALAKHYSALELLVRDSFLVTPESLPTYYGTILALPWARVYSLNVDNLPDVAQMKFQLPRRIEVSSALHGDEWRGSNAGTGLRWIALNGRALDGPSGMTFGRQQYSDRLAMHDAPMEECAASIMTQPVVYIGTRLDEVHLYQHVALRGVKRSGERELRRKGFLVAPELNRVRRDLMQSQFNVHHVAMGLEEFVARVLEPIQASIRSASVPPDVGAIAERRGTIPSVAVLSAGTGMGSPDYLLGKSPEWADVQAGYAIRRVCDADLVAKVTEALGDDTSPNLILVTGTAGTGKSTTMIRAALELTAAGADIGWIDSSMEFAPRQIRDDLDRNPDRRVVFIDEYEQGVMDQVELARAFRIGRQRRIFVMSVRAGRAGRLLDVLAGSLVPVREVEIPLLHNDDIEELIASLDRAHRLGVLKGLKHAERVAAFKVRAGRQLLVAMLEATSGRAFEAKITDEFSDLGGLERNMYALVSIATAVGSRTTRMEVVQALGGRPNEVMMTLDGMIRRGLLVQRAGTSGIEARHKVIADKLLNHLASEGLLSEVMCRLAFVCALAVWPEIPRERQQYKRVRQLMGHEFLKGLLGADGAREVYAELEARMAWDYHFWLQRGALEVETGGFAEASNYLGAAYSLESNDALVLVEYGYLKCKEGATEPVLANALDLFEDGMGLLERAIQKRGATDPHAYQIVGEQTIRFCSRADIDDVERRRRARRAVELVEEGYRRHHSDKRLPRVLDELRKQRA